MKRHVVLLALVMGLLAPSQAQQGSQNKASKAETVLEDAGKLASSLSKQQDLPTLTKMSSAMAAAGPALLLAATIVPQLQQKSKPKMQSIKEKFQSLDKKLSSLESGIQDLKNLVRMSSAQVSYQEACNVIDNVFHEWSLFADSPQNDMDRQEFLRHYGSYHNAALNLWRGMVPSGNNVLAFDLLQTYKAMVSCNPFKTLLFCINMMEYINKGLAVEGAYYALQNNTDRVIRSEREWADRLNMLNARCSSISSECSANWRELGKDVMQRVYDRFVETADHSTLAKHIYDALVENLPQRRWGVWVYDDASGYSEHAVISPHTLRIWDRNKIDVSAVGLDPEKAFTSFDEVRVKTAFEKVYQDASRARGCSVFNKGEYYKDRALVLADKMFDNLAQKPEVERSVYVIEDKKKIAFVAFPERSFQAVVKTHCVDPALRLFVFQ